MDENVPFLGNSLNHDFTAIPTGSGVIKKAISMKYQDGRNNLKFLVLNQNVPGIINTCFYFLHSI